MKFHLVFLLLLVLSVSVWSRELKKCKRYYKKIGCYKQAYSMWSLTSMHVNYRDHIVWTNFPASVHDMVCRCNKEARARNLTYFAIRFWGECWGGNSAPFINNRYARTWNCRGVDYKKCIDAANTECVGVSFTDYLYKSFAPIDGGWTPWKASGKCSKTCGGGMRIYTRSCTNPKPQYGGKRCIGSDTERRPCNTHPCPIDGGWTQWVATAACSKPCGGGTQPFTRSCTNPKPQHGGKPCQGPANEVRPCNIQPCPIDGGWTPFRPVGVCSRPCGGGLQLFSRTCTNPRPQHGGRPCVGLRTVNLRCNVQPCPIDGGWTPWVAAGVCSEPCGPGVQVFTRSCTNPRPQFGGRNCVGLSIENRPCQIKPCPVDGGWTKWTAAGKCTKSCGGGTQPFTRSCTRPRPQHGGKNCMGLPRENRKCNTQPCPIDGGWSAWKPAEECDKSCGGGMKLYNRSCTNPKPQHGGKNCSGDSEEMRPCNTQPCPIDGGWTPWEAAGECSKSCNGGIQPFTRNCTKPEPQHGGKPCQGLPNENRPCNTQPCPIDGGWGPWFVAKKCNATCGGGTALYKRICNIPIPKHGGKECDGDSEQSRACNTEPCPASSYVPIVPS